MNKHCQKRKEIKAGGPAKNPVVPSRLPLPSNTSTFGAGGNCVQSATLFGGESSAEHLERIKVEWCAHLLVSNSLINGGELVSVGGERPMPSSSVREAFDTANWERIFRG